MEKHKKGETLLKLFLTKKIKNAISKNELNKIDELKESKLSKNSTIISKMSVSPLNLNIKKIEKTKEIHEEEEDPPKIYNKVSKLKKSKTFMSKPIIKQNNNLNNFSKLKEKLTNISQLIIHQESDISEILCGCQQPNNYHVYIPESGGKKKYIYHLREFSGKCNRICIPVNCRGFTMKMKLKSNKDKKQDKDFKDSVITIQKDFTIPCLCLCRPEMEVNLASENTFLGKIEKSFSIFDPSFTVYNEENEEIKYIEADCCQCGFIFRNYSIGKSDDCQFLIYNSREKTESIGYIVKKTESVYSLADDYYLKFPPEISPEEKILLSIVAVLIDYQYYEKNNEVIK